jgi:hypothetical protein
VDILRIFAKRPAISQASRIRQNCEDSKCARHEQRFRLRATLKHPKIRLAQSAFAQVLGKSLKICESGLFPSHEPFWICLS